MLHLAEGLDAKQLATAYRTHGRLQIRDFLAEPARPRCTASSPTASTGASPSTAAR
jgi:hypothetical protein